MTGRETWSDKDPRSGIPPFSPTPGLGGFLQDWQSQADFVL